MVNKINVCGFIIGVEQFKICNIGGLEFKVSHPYYAVQAKATYVANLLYEQKKGAILDEAQQKRLTKHLLDISAYRQVFPDSSFGLPF